MPLEPPAESPEIGRDALDVVPAGRARARGWRILSARRAALGIGAAATPSLAFVLTGFVLGPQVLGVVSSRALAYLDSVVSVALAMLGVFIGLGFGRLQERTTRWSLLAATVESIVTVAVVALALYMLFDQWTFLPPAGAANFAVMLGICSAASAAVPVGSDAHQHERIAARIADVEDAPLIGLGAVVVAAAGVGLAPAIQVLVTAFVGLAVGAAGWLLFEHAHGDAERGVFVTGAIVLLGGLAAFLNASPLLAGCLAALVWVRAPGAADRIIASDVQKLQHPLVALLLLVAGASVQLTQVLAWIAAPLVLVRLTGKLLGSAAAARITGAPAGLIATVLVPPGVVGIALALNMQQALGSDDALLVSGVTVAAAASEILGVVLPPLEEDAG